ncbi:MAG: hypothetical protein GWN87_30655, partial [Desulfuromonadales bacterium]|nr:hypothetical protein [Desulfuromonadales bacterium]NIS43925.1 hypothetical protein [Desulfuromonadales bacterium]
VLYEQARTPEDVLRRRTGLMLAAGQGLAELEPVADQMQALLGVDDTIKRKWLTDYRETISRSGRN